MLKITKISISPQQFDRSLRNLVRWCKMGLITAPTVKKFEFQKSNMADGRHFENRKIATSLQPRDRFWWNLAQWHILDPYSESSVKKNFEFVKIQDGGGRHLKKITIIAISLQRFDQSLRNLVRWCKMGLLTSQIVKKLNFINPRWRTAAILKYVLGCHLSVNKVSSYSYNQGCS